MKATIAVENYARKGIEFFFLSFSSVCLFSTPSLHCVARRKTHPPRAGLLSPLKALWYQIESYSVKKMSLDALSLVRTPMRLIDLANGLTD